MEILTKLLLEAAEKEDKVFEIRSIFELDNYVGDFQEVLMKDANELKPEDRHNFAKEKTKEFVDILKGPIGIDGIDFDKMWDELVESSLDEVVEHISGCDCPGCRLQRGEELTDEQKKDLEEHSFESEEHLRDFLSSVGVPGEVIDKIVENSPVKEYPANITFSKTNLANIGKFKKQLLN